MLPNERKALCVSIHDVAPETWPDCLRLLQAVRAVADIPLTLLVVPQYHGNSQQSDSYEAMLGELLAQGHELALHGYTHLDTAPARGNLRSRFIRNVYTQREGEFAAIDAAEARRRIELGLAWFRQRHWPVHGFIAPAWLMGEGAWEAVRQFPFAYTTTLGHFYFLAQRRSLFSPSLVYTARNATGRQVSPRWAELLTYFLNMAPMSPLVRLSLHPRDARYPQLVRHFQRLLEQLLAVREPLTKAAFAQQSRNRPK